MSHQSTAYPHPEYASRPSHGRPQTAAAVSRAVQRAHGKRADYTLTHGGRQVRIGPIAFWIVVGTLVIMAVWSIGTGTYFAFREDVLTRLIGRQADMQFAYEDRIAELRAQVDRITSRQLLDQEQFEQKLNALLKRQAVLEQRTAALSGDSLTTGSIRTPKTIPAPAADLPEPKLRASPISDTVIFSTPPDREARLESRDVPVSTARVADGVKAVGLEGILAKVSFALDKVEKRQMSVLSHMEEQADSKVNRMQSVLADLGLNLGKMPRPRGVGGPFIPLRAPKSGASEFDRALYRVDVARAQADRYTQAFNTVPVRKPVTGELDMTSPFGVRNDPFLGRPSMHPGIDLRGEIGEPVHATAAGHITIAGRDGGYGNLVEINHGNGLATRYGHLSEIDVKVGENVHIGEVIGKIGSTGRSTGPHLHYETRIDGEAVNPQKFLRAGLRLGNG
jgi:murein DD-endopeptidase MepM/ murein hydrolase activator NlpD